jgi:tetratricopeptide (TPR) repeat protein
MLRRAIALALLLLPARCPAQAPADGGWVGKRVITQYGTVLVDDRPGGKVDDEGRDRCDFRIYRVASVNGPRLWLKDEHSSAEGWAEADRVIPLDQAIAYLTDMIRANPAQPAIYNWRGFVWRERGRLDAAIADFTEGIRLDPKEPMYRQNRGIAWSDKREYVQAIADFTEAIRLDPRYVSAYGCRGIAWYDKKEYDKAIADYDEAIRRDPKSLTTYNNRGNAWAKKKEYDKAIADFTEAIRLDPKAARVYPNRGKAWRARKEFDKAIADYGEAIRLDPKSEAAYNGRAWLRAVCPEARYRDGKAAVADATKACELSQWKHPFCLGTLAAAHAESGSFPKAVEMQEKAQGFYTDDDDLKHGRERLTLYKAGKPYRED